MQRRLVCFAGSSVAVEYSGDPPARIVDFLYRHAATDDRTPPHTTYRLLAGDESDQLVLYRDDTLICGGASGAAVAQLLLGDSCYHLAWYSQGGLLFHAGALVLNGKGLLLPGEIGAGKTTVTAWLALKGLDYLTDELAFIPHGADNIQAFTRPLNLKKPSRTVLKDHFHFEGHADRILSTPHGDLVPPALLNPTNMLSQPPVSLIVFPHYRPGGDFIMRPLSRAQAGLALMECLVNARSLPDHGFPEIVRLAKMAPAYKMTYAHFDQVGEQIETLLQSLPYGETK
jgi:hypothetical protein